jgi:hypothetical protein
MLTLPGEPGAKRVWQALRGDWMTLFGEYLGGHHRPIHKWHQYFPVYEQHFERFRNRHLTIFEIGVGEGGSLQLWRGYFGPFATIVGIDVYPRCKQLEDGQVQIRIGRQNDPAFLAALVAEFGPPDIVIDDGSHLQADINATFDFLYPKVAKNGVYLVEDLHAAYWPDHGGGLRVPGSFVETAKHYVDLLHADYVRGAAIATPAGDRTNSVHFYDSVIVFEVGEHLVMQNGTTGDTTLFDGGWAPPGESREIYARYIDETLSDLQVPGPQHEPPRPEPDRIALLEQEVALLRASTSWRITRPLRAIGSIFRRRK